MWPALDRESDHLPYATTYSKYQTSPQSNHHSDCKRPRTIFNVELLALDGRVWSIQVSPCSLYVLCCCSQTSQYTKNLQRTFSDNMGLHTSQVIETVCNKLSSIKCSKVDESGPLLGRDPLWFDSCNQLQSNLSNTDTQGTEQSVRIREVSV